MSNQIPTDFPKIPGYNLNARPRVNLFKHTQDFTAELLQEQEELDIPLDSEPDDICSLERAMHGKVDIMTFEEEVNRVPMVSFLLAKPTNEGIIYQYAFEEYYGEYGLYEVAKTESQLTLGQLTGC